MARARRRQLTNSVRIIGGEFRGRRLAFADIDGLRPSTDRVRETLFNWLQPIVPGARCLDLFSGSGVLGFEALSRGAAQVAFVDTERRVCLQLKQNLEVLKTDNAVVNCLSADQYLATYDGPAFDIVFLDPPFQKDLLQSICELLEQSSHLADRAQIYLEAEFPLENLQLPQNWTLLKHKKAGAVHYGLVARGQA